MSHEGQRGATLLEVLVAGAVLLVALLGFAAVVTTSSSATAVAHRRSAATYFRAGLLDRYLVTARSTIAGLTPDTWIVDGCYDEHSQVVATNASLSSTFTCPNTSFYRTWVRVTSASPASGPWTLSLYAERIVPGCAADERYANLACVAADLLVTD